MAVDVGSLLDQYTKNRSLHNDNRRADATQDFNMELKRNQEKRTQDTYDRGIVKAEKDKNIAENKRLFLALDYAGKSNDYAGASVAIKNLHDKGLIDLNTSSSVYKSGAEDLISGYGDTTNAKALLKYFSNNVTSLNKSRKNLELAGFNSNKDGNFIPFFKDNTGNEYPATQSQSSKDDDEVVVLTSQQLMDMAGTAINTKQGIEQALEVIGTNDPAAYNGIFTNKRTSGISIGTEYKDPTKDYKTTTTEVDGYIHKTTSDKAGNTIKKEVFDAEGKLISSTGSGETTSTPTNYSKKERSFGKTKNKFKASGANPKKVNALVKDFIELQKANPNITEDDYLGKVREKDPSYFTKETKPTDIKKPGKVDVKSLKSDLKGDLKQYMRTNRKSSREAIKKTHTLDKFMKGENIAFSIDSYKNYQIRGAYDKYIDSIYVYTNKAKEELMSEYKKTYSLDQFKADNPGKYKGRSGAVDLKNDYKKYVEKQILQDL